MRKCCCRPPVPEKPFHFYAQYRTIFNGDSGSFLPFQEVFRSGNEIRLENSTTILLPTGYLYLINYLMLATPESNSYMELVPYLNGTARTLYTFLAPTGSGSRNASAAGSFTTNEANAGDLRCSIRLTYPETVRNIDLSGSVSITPLMRL